MSSKQRSNIVGTVSDDDPNSNDASIMMQGYMMKKKTSSPSLIQIITLKWVTRYFILHADGKLVYYRDSNLGKEELLCTNVADCNIERVKTKDFDSRADYVNNSFYIAVPGGGKTNCTLFVTHGPADFKRWIRSFREMNAGIVEDADTRFQSKLLQSGTPTPSVMTINQCNSFPCAEPPSDTISTMPSPPLSNDTRIQCQTLPTQTPPSFHINRNPDNLCLYTNPSSSRISNTSLSSSVPRSKQAYSDIVTIHKFRVPQRWYVTVMVGITFAAMVFSRLSPLLYRIRTNADEDVDNQRSHYFAQQKQLQSEKNTQIKVPDEELWTSENSPSETLESFNQHPLPSNYKNLDEFSEELSTLEPLLTCIASTIELDDEEEYYNETITNDEEFNHIFESEFWKIKPEQFTEATKTIPLKKILDKYNVEMWIMGRKRSQEGDQSNLLSYELERFYAPDSDEKGSTT